MLFFFKNFIKQYRFNRSLQFGFELIKSGKQEEAFQEFNSLLSQEPYNPYVRRQLLILGDQLHKKVKLPSAVPKYM